MLILFIIFLIGGMAYSACREVYHRKMRQRHRERILRDRYF